MPKTKNIVSWKNNDLISAKIEKYIEELLSQDRLKAGDRLLPESEIGKMFNASNKPVRLAMQKFVRQGILEKVRGRGTFVKKIYGQKAPAATNRIGIIYCHSREGLFASSFYTSLISGIEAEAHAEQKNLLLRSVVAHSAEDPGRVMETLAQEVDGFILVDPLESVYRRMQAALAMCAKPVVTLNTDISCGDLDAIVPDNEGDVRKMVGFLAGLGHSRMACAVSRTYEGTIPLNMEQRLNAFRAAMTEKGLLAGPATALCFMHDKQSSDATLIDPDSMALYSNTAADEAAFTALLRGPQPPTALVCCGDDIAFYAYKLARKNGLAIPDDLTVVGYDDMREAALIKPGLTTIRTPLGEMGSKALRRVLEKMREKEQGLVTVNRIVIAGKLIERQSHRQIQI